MRTRSMLQKLTNFAVWVHHLGSSRRMCYITRSANEPRPLSSEPVSSRANLPIRFEPDPPSPYVGMEAW